MSRFFTIKFFAIGLLGLTTVLGVGCQPATETETAGTEAAMGTVLFRAPAGELGLQTGTLAAGKAPEDMVEVTLPGRLFDPPQEVATVTKENADHSSAMTAAASDYSAFRAKDSDWVLENFSDDDRTDILNLLANEVASETNWKLFGALETMQIWGEVELNDYRLILARYNRDELEERELEEGAGPPKTRGGLVLTFVETPDGWKRTNALKADETFDVVMAAFRSLNGSVASQP